MAIVEEFWMSHSLPDRIKERLIKLIPKKMDKKLLKDWRPLTILNTTYKILAKLLAIRLKRVLPSLISKQQTGFILGRHILENISIAWLTIDWIQKNLIPSLFLKLDFEKAFDRVDHSYIWETMHLLGIGSHFIKLVKGCLYLMLQLSRLTALSPVASPFFVVSGKAALSPQFYLSSLRNHLWT